MKYMLLMYSNQDWKPETPEETQAVAPAVWQALLKEATAAGALLETNGFAPTTSATTVRVRDGRRLVTDGPFAETHEQLGGYFLLDCKDLDQAIGWAEKIPHAKFGAIEIRPLWSPH